VTRAGIDYLSFQVAESLNESDLWLIAQLSFVFALYREEEEKLLPVQLPAHRHVDPKISMLLKYSGKTNEIFTRMMINVALLSSRFNGEEPVHLLDPVAGKGTTLFEAATYGFHATGIEVDRQAVQEATTFFRKFLEQERYKHTLEKRKLFSNKESADAFVQDFQYAPEKQAFKDDASRRHLGMVSGNALHVKRYFKDEKFHLIVGDLPYGIAHGNKGRQKHNSLTRSPQELMEATLSDLFKVLKTGGSLVLAWNTFVWPREAFTALLEKAGFQILSGAPYEEFVHRVDQSIKRDIVVALKI